MATHITAETIHTVTRAYAHVPDTTIAAKRRAAKTGEQQTRVLEARRNGATKVWKTRPGEFRAPFKYGLKECFYITNRNCHNFYASAEDAAAAPVVRYPADEC